MRRLVWFSCGASSAIAAKLATERYRNVEVLYCNTLATEHPDNKRFFDDIAAWCGVEIKLLSSDRYADIDDVFASTRYMAGPSGARCTVEMKKRPREQYQRDDDIHIFGYTADEVKRIERFEKQNPALFVEWILRDHGITKADCLARLAAAGIDLPAMYRLGFDHNNCLGCVKASSPHYWNAIRRHFPAVFETRARQSRVLGARLVRYHGQRIFLDELPTTAQDIVVESIECGPICQSGEVDAP